MSTPLLLGLVAGGVIVLLVLITVFRIQAFVALLATSMLIAILGGVPLSEVATQIQDGMGSTLGYIAVVVGLGAMFGEMLQVSGGASTIAYRLLERAGEDRAPLALGLTGLVVAIPVFFDVAFILLVPLVYSLTKRTGRPILYFAIPLAAGLAVAHSFVPPTPGPVLVAGLLGADLGWVILFGVIAAVPSMLLGGILFGRFISTRVDQGLTEDLPIMEDVGDQRSPASFRVALALVLLPLGLILVGTLASVLQDSMSVADAGAGVGGDGVWPGAVLDAMRFVGHPFTALLLTVFASFYWLGTRCGYSRSEVQRFATKSLEPVGLIILVTGAGGVFGKVLIAVGVGDAVAQGVASASAPILLLAFLIAAVVRVTQGSATVAMVTAAGLLSPLVATSGTPPISLALITISIASGATVLSHFNDSGFWLVSRYLGLTEKDTLRSWTVMETVIGATGLACVLLISLFV
jgi:gluconate transporter